jgi:hypothetical protein
VLSSQCSRMRAKTSRGPIAVRICSPIAVLLPAKHH